MSSNFSKTRPQIILFSQEKIPVPFCPFCGQQLIADIDRFCHLIDYAPCPHVEFLITDIGDWEVIEAKGPFERYWEKYENSEQIFWGKNDEDEFDDGEFEEKELTWLINESDFQGMEKFFMKLGYDSNLLIYIVENMEMACGPCYFHWFFGLRLAPDKKELPFDVNQGRESREDREDEKCENDEEEKYDKEPPQIILFSQKNLPFPFCPFCGTQLIMEHMAEYKLCNHVEFLIVYKDDAWHLLDAQWRFGRYWAKYEDSDGVWREDAWKPQGEEKPLDKKRFRKGKLTQLLGENDFRGMRKFFIDLGYDSNLLVYIVENEGMGCCVFGLRFVPDEIGFSWLPEEDEEDEEDKEDKEDDEDKEDENPVRTMVRTIRMANTAKKTEKAEKKTGKTGKKGETGEGGKKNARTNVKTRKGNQKKSAGADKGADKVDKEE